MRRSVEQIVRECINEALLRKKIDTWKQRLSKKAKNFCNFNTETLPIAYGLDYMPQSKCKNPNVKQKQAQDFIYCIKRDNDNYDNNQYQKVKSRAASFVVQTLFRCFGNDVANLVLVPIPTHDNQSNTRRWKELISTICGRCQAQNGFGHFQYKGETTPSHFNKGSISQEKKGVWDKQFFMQKDVVLRDDFLTTGQSMEKAKAELERMGANVIMGIVFGKTISDK